MATLNRHRTGNAVAKFIRRNLLVILILMSMLFGIVLGCVLRTTGSLVDRRNHFYLKFPGDIMLNTLRMVSVPLVVSSIVSSLASLSMKTSGSIGLKALIYYLVTTVCAVITGTVGIVVISIGKEAAEQPGRISNSMSQLDSVLDMMRNALPDNLVKATFSKKQTVLSKHNVEIVNDTGSVIFNNTEDIAGRNWSSSFMAVEVPTVISVPGTNMLGLIVVSVFLGCVLSSMEDKAKPLVDFFQCIYQAMMRLILIFIW
ncbi:excitatory amino acid transporter 1-like [Mizuhopecten yessoensis]|uniref:excitatory amino acid transporter 1-like n=1 Tax=Mizuhopecten yessoensis TaxID=6573 RepID=UPI000B45CD6F|nr:excitatory amino acid transporter 1-like [Mizuhopecten yessoensis]